MYFQTACVRAGQYWRQTLSTGKVTQFTCAFGKSNHHWFLRHDLNWGTWFLPVSHVGFYFIFSFLSQRYGKHLSQWCISERHICGSFFNFLEDLLAFYFLFCLWQENKTKKTPCTAKARSGKAWMSLTPLRLLHLRQTLQNFQIHKTKTSVRVSLMSVYVSSWQFETWNMASP